VVDLIALKQKLKEFSKDYKKIVILGIGNEIKGDDAIGPIIAGKLSELYHKHSDIIAFDGGTVPENYTGSIRKENPSHIILIDAVEMNEEPGFIRMVKKEEIASYNISTHAMPVSFLIKYLETTIEAEIILIGIQPLNMGFNEIITFEIQESIDEVIKTFVELIEP
jgi:hydrogenase 3 maturation protease